MSNTQCHYIQTNVFNWIPTVTGNQFGLVYYTWVLIFLSILGLFLDTCDHLVQCHEVTGSVVLVCNVRLVCYPLSLMRVWYTHAVMVVLTRVRKHYACMHMLHVCVQRMFVVYKINDKALYSM